MKKKKFYAFFVNDESKIVNKWEDCKREVEGVKGARYKSFSTMEEAEKWLKEGARYSLKRDQKPIEKKEIDKNAIYFDSGTGRNGEVEISVTDFEGIPLLFKVVPEERVTKYGTMLLGKGKTNNFGELAALFIALKVAIKMNIKKICGDSKLIIDYWSNGHVSKKKREDKELMKLVKMVCELKKEFEKKGGKIERIKGSINPADIGFHRD